MDRDTLQRIVTGTVFMGMALACAQAQADSDPGLRAGEVRLTAAVGDAIVKLVETGPKVMQVLVNGRVVLEDHEGRSIGFINAYDTAGRWLVLLRQGVEGGCPASYRVLDLSGPQPTVSLPFGTCGKSLEVASTAQALTVSMPLDGGKGDAAWTYQNGRVVRVR